MKPKLLAAASVLAISLALAGCKSSSNFAPAVASPVGWTVAYSFNMPNLLPTLPTGESFFDFPNANGVHYIIRRSLARIGQTITLRFALVGEGRLVPTEGTASARVRLFLQRQGDTLTAQEPNKRWWSKAFVELVSPGEYVLTAQVVPEQWTQVFGVSGDEIPESFAECVANLEHVGFTFGGTFAGHGVYAEGDVRFILKEFSIT